MALTVKFQPFAFLNFLNQFWYFFGIPAFFLSPIISSISFEYFFDIYIYIYLYFLIFFVGTQKWVTTMIFKKNSRDL